MAKSPKKGAPAAPTTTPTTTPTSDSVLDDALLTLNEGLGGLRTEIAKIRDGTAVANGHDPASRIAFLTGKVGAIADSIRKVESARAKRVAGLTPSLVLAWFRQLDPSEQQQFLASLTGDGQRKGIFG